MSAIAPRPSPAPPRRRALGALRHRNFRLFLGGQVVSTVGTWMQSIAQPWLVLQLTHSALLVGLVLAVQHLPMVAAGPFGGRLAGRLPRRRALQVTQAALALPALFLFAVSWAHVVTFPMILLGALAWGLVQVVDAPTRQELAIEMVGRHDLANAVALNSSISNAAAVAGPAVAGVLIAVWGVPLCFLLNAVSYVALLVGLTLMKSLPSLLPGPGRQSVAGQVVEGARYVRCDPVVGAMLVVVAAFSLFAANRLALVPLFADQVLHAGAAGFGLLMAALGLGALAGVLALSLAPGAASGRRQLWAGVVWSASLLAFSACRSLPASLALLVLAGGCQTWFLAAASARAQAATPDRLRGRVMAFYSQAVMGVGPAGALLAGALASALGVPVATAAGAGAVCLVLIGARLLSPPVFTLEPHHYQP